MKIMFRVLTALIIALLVGCASTPPVYPTAFQSIPRDELNRYFDAKKVGMVLLVADKKLDKKLKIDVLRYTGYGNINKTTSIGQKTCCSSELNLDRDVYCLLRSNPVGVKKIDAY